MTIFEVIAVALSAGVLLSAYASDLGADVVLAIVSCLTWWEGPPAWTGERSHNLWHAHCKISANWDFSAQFENETLPGHVFRARQRSIL